MLEVCPLVVMMMTMMMSGLFALSHSKHQLLNTFIRAVIKGRGFPPASMSMNPGYFGIANKRKIKPKELPIAVEFSAY